MKRSSSNSALTKLAGGLIIVLLIVAGAAAYLMLRPPSGHRDTGNVTSSTTTNTTTTLPPTKITTTTTISTANTTTTTTLGKRIEYGAKVFSLSYGHIGTATWPVVEDELLLLKGMGIRHYAIHLNYDPWLRNQTDKISIVDQAVKWIRANNGSLHIVDAGAESLRKNPVSWDDFKALFRTRIDDWAQRYNPEIMTVIKEPGYYLPFIKDLRNLNITDLITDFILLGFELNAAVKSISPTTRTMYAENARPLIDGGIPVEMLNMMMKDSNLDIVGLDIYGYQCGEDNKTLYLEQVVESISNAGKEIWIAETWATTWKGMASCSTLSEAEIAWAQHISEYAVNRKIPVVEWFFTQQFGTTADPSPTYLGIQKSMEHFR